jgi:hypothetical protein
VAIEKLKRWHPTSARDRGDLPEGGFSLSIDGERKEESK